MFYLKKKQYNISALHLSSTPPSHQWPPLLFRLCSPQHPHPPSTPPQLSTPSTTPSFSGLESPLNITGTALSWLKSYRTNRQQFIGINNLHLLHHSSVPRRPPRYGAWSSPVHPVHAPHWEHRPLPMLRDDSIKSINFCNSHHHD